MVSVLGDYTYEFPKEFPLELRLKDMLEKEVDEKFYLDGKALEYINKRVGVYTQICDEKTETTKCAITAKGNQNWTGNFITEQPMLIGGMQENQSVKTDGISTTLTSSMGTGGGYVPMVTEPKCEQVGMLSGGKWDRMHDVSRRVYSGDGVAPTLHTCGGGNTEPKITEPLALDEQNGYIRKCGTVGTLTTDGSSPKHNNRVIEGARIRKLTPKECFRLMGFDDADFDKAAELNSNSQLYKQAGNSIVVDVLYYIFKEMF
jgi:DNA (cytosine-5)-methyltransferase 1